MDLSENAFYLLSATPRDDRRRIVELAEERALLHGSDDCSRARSDLTNPRKRLEFEVAWFPGVGPKRAAEVLSLLESAPSDLLTTSGLTPMSRVNALAAGLKRLPQSTPQDIATWILAIAHAFDEVDPAELCAHVNEDREVSRFPAVTDLRQVEQEIQSRGRHCGRVFKLALDSLDTTDLVEAVTLAIESATDCGEAQGPALIHDLAEAYEVEAQGFLEKETRSIQELVKRIQDAADSRADDPNLASMIARLVRMVKNWDLVAQPVQVSKMSQGMRHTASHELAILLRELAVHLHNAHGRLDLAQELTTMIQDVFAEVVEVAERAAEDADTLADFARSRGAVRAEITYEVEIGGLFKNKFRISPEGIEWKNRHWDLNSITRIRWGGVRHSVNGIPTGTTYHIVFGTESNGESIDLHSEQVFSAILDRMWKTVGVRLLDRFLRKLRGGEPDSFGPLVVSDTGVVFSRKRLFAKEEVVFCPWANLVISTGPGYFHISHKNERGLSADLSYLDVDNVHILEVALRSFFKSGEDLLSSLLENGL